MKRHIIAGVLVAMLLVQDSPVSAVAERHYTVDAICGNRFNPPPFVWRGTDFWRVTKHVCQFLPAVGEGKEIGQCGQNQ